MPKKKNKTTKWDYRYFEYMSGPMFIMNVFQMLRISKQYKCTLETLEELSRLVVAHIYTKYKISLFIPWDLDKIKESMSFDMIYTVLTEEEKIVLKYNAKEVPDNYMTVHDRHDEEFLDQFFDILAYVLTVWDQEQDKW